ncbi:protein kinase [Zhihengliuella sp.]|uniref:serine/threonine-protein kinase n=1 Tax=Zhihengliuella sp. TaxID=1954483 RepID=UPI002811C364|nr:protein kinase [Zhihengliuella sp.]
MTGKRPPSPPPQIPGFSYVRQLGSGGFSDVYLFEQERPRRTVAIKVLFGDVTTEESRRNFESEANLMAQLSSHPNIVTIYQADVTADGRSYLVMEYCPRASLDVRYRQGPLRVDETLSLGIHIASAVETAHRAGIVHRDIKPANILTTAYNRPALTDFGISGNIGAASDEVGMSIPWSAPEAFAGPNADGVLLDVYALGATVYTLLAGHSPFVRPGADNTQNKLIHRITNSRLEPLTRNDVPESLNQALAVAMAKSPTSRFGAAADFARSLQRIQAELGLAVTPIEVLDDSADHGGWNGEEDDDAPATRVRSVRSIDPGQATPGTTPAVRDQSDGGRRPGGPAAERGAGHGAAQGTAQGAGPDGRDAEHGRRADQRLAAHGQQDGPAPNGPGQHGPDQHGTRYDPPSAPGGTGADGPRQRFPVLLVAAVVVAMIVAAAVVMNLLGGTQEEPQGLEGLSQGPVDAVDPGASVPAVIGFKHSTVGENVTFTWRNPEPQDGDFYLWSTVTATEESPEQRTQPASATVERRTDGPTCIQVIMVRDDGRTSDPARYCTPDSGGGDS